MILWQEEDMVVKTEAKKAGNLVAEEEIKHQNAVTQKGEDRMIYFFRIYGRGWFVTSSKLIAEHKHKHYKELGLARQPIRKRKGWVELD